MVSTLFTMVGCPKAPLTAGNGGLILRPALLALERGQEAGLLAADVGARAAMDHDVEVEARALDVLAEEARLRRPPSTAPLKHLPRLHVLAADVDEGEVRADGARRDDHALDRWRADRAP